MSPRLLGHRVHGDDAGYTVNEVMVTLMIMSIVTVIIFNFLINTTDIAARSEANARREMDAQLALREVTAELRAMEPGSATACAAPLPTSLNNCVRFNIHRTNDGVGPCPKTDVTVALTGTAPDRTIIIQKREFGASPGGTCNATPTSTVTRTVLQKVKNDLAASPPENLLTFYAGDGSVLNPATAGFVFASVDSLALRFKVDYHKNARRLEYRSVVALRNNNDR